MKISALTERLSQKIITMIDSGGLLPGTHISVPKLAEFFDVSRSPVREALVYLEHKGILQQQRNRFLLLNRIMPHLLRALMKVKSTTIYLSIIS